MIYYRDRSRQGRAFAGEVDMDPDPIFKKNLIQIRPEKKLDPNPESNPRKTIRIRPNKNHPQLFSFYKKVNIINTSSDKTGSGSEKQTDQDQDPPPWPVISLERNSKDLLRCLHVKSSHLKMIKLKLNS